jgi:GNAT superfamily N-acetyltransferase
MDDDARNPYDAARDADFVMRDGEAKRGPEKLAAEAASCTFVERRPDHDDARTLLARYVAELEARFRVKLDFDEMIAAADLVAPRGAFFVLYDGARAIACGGVRRFDATAWEVKRMFVAPEARRRGHARRVLAKLEDEARTRGATRMVLDTDARDEEALALYESSGYTRVPKYNDNADASAWLAKTFSKG